MQESYLLKPDSKVIRFVFFFNGISAFVGYLIPKLSLQMNNIGTINL